MRWRTTGVFWVSVVTAVVSLSYLVWKAAGLPPPGAEPPAALLQRIQGPAPWPAPSPADASPPSERLGMPVQGIRRSDLRDSYAEARGGHRHEAIDILAPRGTPVLAVADGTIAKLFKSVAGGLTVYEFDRTATYCYYYAHLDRYAEGLRQGQSVRRGERIGHVGSSGDASPKAPHLHFAIFRLGPEKHWWEGVPINPYPPLLNVAPKN